MIEDEVITGMITVLILGLYFLPPVIAQWRKHRNAMAIGVLDLLVGWTFVGWVVAPGVGAVSDGPPRRARCNARLTRAIQLEPYKAPAATFGAFALAAGVIARGHIT